MLSWQSNLGPNAEQTIKCPNHYTIQYRIAIEFNRLYRTTEFRVLFEGRNIFLGNNYNIFGQMPLDLDWGEGGDEYNDDSGSRERMNQGSRKTRRRDDLGPIEMRKAVTSPGGTTAAAIAQLEKEDFPGLLARAVMAAHNRAVQLGR